MRRDDLVSNTRDITSQLPDIKPWLLIFGGITHAGRRRASRFAERGSEKDLAIVCFDGYSSEPVSECGEAVVIAYAHLELDSIGARLARYTPPGEGRLILLFRKLVRRIGTLFRPYLTWRLLRPVVLGLGSARAPVAIAYCDDSAIPLAWHAARMWSAPPVISDPSDL